MFERHIINRALNSFIADAVKYPPLHWVEKHTKLADNAKDLAVQVYAAKTVTEAKHLILVNKKLLQALYSGSSFYSLMSIIKTPAKKQAYEPVI